ncbi:MAG TPA: aminotransferase class I/II-fold pyridoxal phosphate-dependent enzyme [Acidimicrobiia bacterium]
MNPRIRLSEPTVGPPETEAVARAVSAGELTFGPDLPAFEAGFAAAVGSDDAVAVSTGTAALHLALLVAGVEPGDEVWVSDLTFIASANAAHQCGARITLVDSEAESWNLDPNVVVDELARRRRANEPLPRAIVPVHLLGHPADLQPILAAASEADVAIVEDAAEALGSSWTTGELAGRAPGTVGRLGIFSFNFNKVISTGGGGMVVTQTSEDLARIRHLGSQAKVAGSDYVHDEIGFNYRMSNVAAAIGAHQIARLPDLVERRRTIASRYRDAFAPLGLAGGPDLPWAHRTGWLSSVVLPDPETRAAVRNALDAVQIEARPIWPPLRTQPPYAAAPVLGGTTAVSIANRVLCLPCAAHLTTEQQDEVIDRVLAVLRSG